MALEGDVVASLDEEFSAARRSDEAWDTFVATLKSGPRMDWVVHRATRSGVRNPRPYSTDPWVAIERALDIECSVILEHDEADDLVFTVTVSSRDGYEGVGQHAWLDEDGERCSCSYDPGGPSLQSCRAYTVCRALLAMYSPSEGELAAAAADTPP